MGEVNVQVTQYRVSCLPQDHPDADVWSVTVEWRGGDSWAVCRGSRVLNLAGGWEYEPIPSERGDGFKARCRFDRDLALELATAWAPQIMSCGMTAADVLAREEADRG